MTALRLRLEARAPALRCHRAYEITVGRDLFGIWVAEMTYGRIGAVGRTKTRSFTRIEDAAAAVTCSLRRRATLPHRLGVDIDFAASSYGNMGQRWFAGTTDPASVGAETEA